MTQPSSFDEALDKMLADGRGPRIVRVGPELVPDKQAAKDCALFLALLKHCPDMKEEFKDKLRSKQRGRVLVQKGQSEAFMDWQDLCDDMEKDLGKDPSPEDRTLEWIKTHDQASSIVATVSDGIGTGHPKRTLLMRHDWFAGEKEKHPLERAVFFEQ